MNTASDENKALDDSGKKGLFNQSLLKADMVNDFTCSMDMLQKSND